MGMQAASRQNILQEKSALDDHLLRNDFEVSLLFRISEKARQEWAQQTSMWRGRTKELYIVGLLRGGPASGGMLLLSCGMFLLQILPPIYLIGDEAM